MAAGLKTLAGRLQGHRQWTDAALLWQATDRDGVLVSFDAGVKELAAKDFGACVPILNRG